MASRKIFRHFRQANFFMFVLLNKSSYGFLSFKLIATCELFKKLELNEPLKLYDYLYEVLAKLSSLHNPDNHKPIFVPDVPCQIQFHGCYSPIFQAKQKIQIKDLLSHKVVLKRYFYKPLSSRLKPCKTVCRTEIPENQRGLEETRPGYEAYYNRCPGAADAASFKMAEKEVKDGYEGYDIFSAFFPLLI